jgi:hypothetical protein
MSSKTGIAIALAWPETYCKQAGGWYDSLLMFLGFNRGHYYQAGHAALILIKKLDSEIHYFDFGRYHAPKGFGRVRNAKTDPDLTLPINAQWTRSGELQNLPAILKALNANSAYHGDGILHASSCHVDFERGFAKAKEIQDRSPVIYGPFVYRGTNCSRFVNTVLINSRPGWFRKLRLYFPLTLTPSPMSNVRSLGKISKDGSASQKLVPFCVNPNGTLPEPLRPSNIPSHARWLSGEGAGSWFILDKFIGDFLIHRFNPVGEIEFDAVYESSGKINLNAPYELTYLSHFQKIKILQNGNLIELNQKGVRNLKDILKQNLISSKEYKKLIEH